MIYRMVENAIILMVINLVNIQVEVKRAKLLALSDCELSQELKNS